MFGLTLRPHCTCNTNKRDISLERHYLGCDVMGIKNLWPRRRKKFFLFYPTVEKGRGNWLSRLLKR